VVEVAPLPLELLMLPRQECYHTAVALATLLAPADSPLRFGNPCFRAAIVSRMLHDFPLGDDAEHRGTHVEARLPPVGG
jgi:hypothetical protein